MRDCIAATYFVNTTLFPSIEGAPTDPDVLGEITVSLAGKIGTIIIGLNGSLDVLLMHELFEHVLPIGHPQSVQQLPDEFSLDEHTPSPQNDNSLIFMSGIGLKMLDATHVPFRQ
jgi:hypothetical protein